MLVEFLLITALYLIGQGFHVLQKIGIYRKTYPSLGFSEIWGTFFKEEWNTLMVSALGLLLIEIAWYVIHREHLSLPTWLHDWGGDYGLSLISGYCLQRLVYKYLGTAEAVLEKRVDTLNGK